MRIGPRLLKHLGRPGLSEVILQPVGARLGDYLNEHLRNPNCLEFSAAVAFVKYSGVRQIEHELSRFSARGAVRIAVGVDCQGTSVEGLTALLAAVEPRGQIWVFHNENDSTFHPKIYMFRERDCADVVIGSGNLTAGGLFTNYEASIALHFELNNAADEAVYRQIEGTIHEWTDPTKGTSLRLNARLMEQLALNGYILTEAQQRDDSEENAKRAIRNFRKDRQQDLFAAGSQGCTSYRSCRAPRAQRFRDVPTTNRRRIRPSPEGQGSQIARNFRASRCERLCTRILGLAATIP